MAEISTIARPYAQGLWKALVDTKQTDNAAEFETILAAVGAAMTNPQVAQLVSDPKLTDEQLYDLIASVLGREAPTEIANLLRVIIENGRLDALPEIAAQFRALKNESDGVADAYIETAFALSKSELDGLMTGLKNKFPGLKLNPIVTVNPDLIGGVSIRVGDRILDGSVRAQLAKMQAALTA